ncbi:hypothetical protein Vlu01_49370 [Micromonospora lutea]|uniref:DUF1918 domain-containing protein n=1 Tax=Micromonospora lutea TaxID=419825 RepID=A0ABQ4J295_9ACTN|nr:hypothetical protein Vlu01_49370 [Micromonospora lutea]
MDACRPGAAFASQGRDRGSSVSRTGLTVGDVIRVPEGGHLPGVGELKLYVAEIVSRTVGAGHVWVEVHGHEVKEDRTLRIRRRYARIRADLAEVLPARGR